MKSAKDAPTFEIIPLEYPGIENIRRNIATWRIVELFSDTEAGKNPTQKIVAAEGSRDFGECLLCLA